MSLASAQTPNTPGTSQSPSSRRTSTAPPLRTSRSTSSTTSTPTGSRHRRQTSGTDSMASSTPRTGSLGSSTSSRRPPMQGRASVAGSEYLGKVSSLSSVSTAYRDRRSMSPGRTLENVIDSSPQRSRFIRHSTTGVSSNSSLLIQTAPPVPNLPNFPSNSTSPRSTLSKKPQPSTSTVAFGMQSARSVGIGSEKKEREREGSGDFGILPPVPPTWLAQQQHKTTANARHRQLDEMERQLAGIESYDYLSSEGLNMLDSIERERSSPEKRREKAVAIAAAAAAARAEVERAERERRRESVQQQLQMQIAMSTGGGDYEESDSSSSEDQPEAVVSSKPKRVVSNHFHTRNSTDDDDDAFSSSDGDFVDLAKTARKDFPVNSSSSSGSSSPPPISQTIAQPWSEPVQSRSSLIRRSIVENFLKKPTSSSPTLSNGNTGTTSSSGSRVSRQQTSSSNLNLDSSTTMNSNQKISSRATPTQRDSRSGTSSNNNITNNGVNPNNPYHEHINPKVTSLQASISTPVASNSVVRARLNSLAPVSELPTSSPKIWEQRKDENRRLSARLSNGRERILETTTNLSDNDELAEENYQNQALSLVKDSLHLKNEQLERKRREAEEGDRSTSDGIEVTKYQSLSSSKSSRMSIAELDIENDQDSKDILGDSIGARGLPPPLEPQNRARKIGVRMSRDGFDKYTSMDVEDILRMSPPAVVSGDSISPDFADHDRLISTETQNVTAPRMSRSASGNKSRPKSRSLKSPPPPELGDIENLPRKQRFSLNSPLIPNVVNDAPPLPTSSQRRQSMKQSLTSLAVTTEREKALLPSPLEPSRRSSSPSSPITPNASSASLPTLLRQRRKSLVERGAQMEPLPPIPSSVPDKFSRLSMPPPSNGSKSNKDAFAAIGATAMGIAKAEANAADARKSLPASFFHGTTTPASIASPKPSADTPTRGSAESSRTSLESSQARSSMDKSVSGYDALSKSPASMSTVNTPRTTPTRLSISDYQGYVNKSSGSRRSSRSSPPPSGERPLSGGQKTPRDENFDDVPPVPPVPKHHSINAGGAVKDLMKTVMMSYENSNAAKGKATSEPAPEATDGTDGEEDFEEKEGTENGMDDEEEEQDILVDEEEIGKDEDPLSPSSATSGGIDIPRTRSSDKLKKSVQIASPPKSGGSGLPRPGEIAARHKVTTTRKRGKTMPSNVDGPPPVLSLPLPPIKMEPITLPQIPVATRKSHVKSPSSSRNRTLATTPTRIPAPVLPVKGPNSASKSMQNLNASANSNTEKDASTSEQSSDDTDSAVKKKNQKQRKFISASTTSLVSEPASSLSSSNRKVSGKSSTGSSSYLASSQSTIKTLRGLAASAPAEKRSVDTNSISSPKTPTSITSTNSFTTNSRKPPSSSGANSLKVHSTTSYGSGLSSSLSSATLGGSSRVRKNSATLLSNSTTTLAPTLPTSITTSAVSRSSAAATSGNSSRRLSLANNSSNQTTSSPSVSNLLEEVVEKEKISLVSVSKYSSAGSTSTSKDSIAPSFSSKHKTIHGQKPVSLHDRLQQLSVGEESESDNLSEMSGATSGADDNMSNYSSHHRSGSTGRDIGIRVAMGPQAALKLYAPYLSLYERGEILEYPQIYFVGQHAQKKQATPENSGSNFGFDDDRGDYQVVMQDHLAYRYEVIECLGKGSFGQVLKCLDHKTGQSAAIKIIRNKKRFHCQALVEVKILENLVKWDPEDKHNNVQMTDHFYFRNHLCIAFECLSMNLYEFIKSNNFQGFSLGLIRRFTAQLLNSLSLLYKHRVVHCDLKPENVLLKHPTKSGIKVIDFGSSCFENEKVYTYIQSRFYRSPEVILGMTYNMAIDMWSLGCILSELYTGFPLFPGENEQEQLACIMEVQGVPEKYLIEMSTRKKLFFDSNNAPRIIPNSKGKKRRPGSKTLAQVLKSNDEVFVDFISKCLIWDPEKRMKPDEALQHEWITERKTILPTTPNTVKNYALGSGSLSGSKKLSTAGRYRSRRDDDSMSSVSTATSAPGSGSMKYTPGYKPNGAYMTPSRKFVDSQSDVGTGARYAGSLGRSAAVSVTSSLYGQPPNSGGSSTYRTNGNQPNGSESRTRKIT